jgi:crossover junction endodeoxyribonuclease RuvC
MGPENTDTDRGVGTLKSSRPPGERIILGIDPGTTVMGFGVLYVAQGGVRLLEAGAVRFAIGEDHTRKLRAIFRETTAIIERHHPDELAIEAQFFGKNVQSMLKLGRAQGVAIAAALQFDMSVTEYAPSRIKQSITGHGKASKEQVAAMLLSILGLPGLPDSTDATDAVAVAVCHHFSGHQRPRPAPRRSSGGGGNGWEAFIRNNPDRLV